MLVLFIWEMPEVQKILYNVFLNCKQPQKRDALKMDVVYLKLDTVASYFQLRKEVLNFKGISTYKFIF